MKLPGNCRVTVRAPPLCDSFCLPYHTCVRPSSLPESAVELVSTPHSRITAYRDKACVNGARRKLAKDESSSCSEVES